MSSPRPLDLEQSATKTAGHLPALLVDAETVANTLMAGAHGRRQGGSGETFWQYRPYTSDDSATRIDWRQSARSAHQLFVRETEWETSAVIGLWSAASASMAYGSDQNGPTKRWRAQVLAVALALLLTRAGERILDLGQSRGGGQGGEGSGSAGAVMAFAEALLARPPLPTDLPPLASRPLAQIVYISDFYDDLDPLLKRLSTIAGTGQPLTLVQISDPAEDAFPFEGRRLFQQAAGQDRIVFGDAAAVRDAYRQARTAHLGTLEDFCRRRGIPLLHHRTDLPATACLSALHAAISGYRFR
ncbi:hypothetical protein PB2503_13029 [Parvularcula bermudensis HTCC2503]|uniref:DUF58 domain-containing protein n=1 Tax=Parvularcula bermudensis (strain ATCC BAA-594 / HTCC2503 / KCTC 12087) TaxID=314260 RepID=E0TG72_PARBH|nr:DUF58 domain-containing protein [Parvularcula bermudensis]ADM10643.1 hypothetical protein PB2503_13029 [Parvularcula bermudensis HTCC2503]